MTAQLIDTALPAASTCDDPAARVTKSLLGYGVIAGPLYVGVSLAQALTREGFDLTRHAWSQLALGEHGWIQVANLAVTGLMLVAFAVGLRRALGDGVASRWAPRLVAVFGLSLVAAAIFPADPSMGFPAGTPEGPGAVSWHGLLHLAAAGIGFTCMAIAGVVIARRFRAEGRQGAAVTARTIGIVFLLTFLAMAGSGALPVTIVAFIAAVVLVMGGTAALAADRYRHVA